MGKNSAGKVAKVGGMSHVLSDEGSGFYLGWEALHVVTKMSDGRIPKSDLLRNILDFYNADNVVELKNFLVHAEDLKVVVASVAKMLLEEANNGQADAQKIVLQGVKELALIAKTAREELAESLPIYVAGIIFKYRYFFDLFVDEMKKRNSEQEVVLVNPHFGAVNYIKAGSPSVLV